MFSSPPRWLPGIALLFAFTAPLAPATAQQPTGPATILPDPTLTPGDTLDVTLADIQEKGYSAKVRNVPVSVKRALYYASAIGTEPRFADIIVEQAAAFDAVNADASAELAVA